MAEEQRQTDVSGLGSATRVHDDDEDELGRQEDFEEETASDGHPGPEAVDNGEWAGEKSVCDAGGGDGANELSGDDGEGALPLDGAEEEETGCDLFI